MLELIGKGRENAVPGARLCEMTGMTDRKVREEIETLRRQGHVIVNLQDGKGYFIPTQIEDVLKQYKQNERRAKSILAQQKKMRAILKAADLLPETKKEVNRKKGA